MIQRLNQQLWLSRLHPLLHIIAAITPLAWNWGLNNQQPPVTVIIITALFGLLPDIDSHTSTIGRSLPFVSKPIERRWGHRTITHSLVSLIFVSLLTYLVYRSHWVWLTAAYGSHLLIDMIFGSGIPLLWPYSTHFYFLQLKSKTTAEGLFTLFATVCLIVPFVAPAIAQRTYSTLTLEVPVLPTPIPTPTTPATFTIKIDNVYDIDAEILIRPGDAITTGQKLASLDIHRQLNTDPTRTPTPTATTTPFPTPSPQPPAPTLYPTIDPLTIAQLENSRNLARARYAAAVATPTPNITGLNLATEYDFQISEHQKCVQWWIDDGNPEAWQRYTCEQAAAELIETRDALLDSMQPEAIRPEDADILRLELQAAELRYQAAINQLTPQPTTPPTQSPTTLHTPTITAIPSTPQPTPTQLPLADPYAVYSQISGEVAAINLAAVNGNSVTVEIIVLIDPADPLFFNPIAQGQNVTNQANAAIDALQAQVVRVVDGDTIIVNFEGGPNEFGLEETVRLLGIDAPESVHPTQPPECYGRQASDYLKALLPAGTTIQIELDPQTGDRDRFNRLLAHIWHNDQLINENILLTGHGRFNNYNNPTSRDDLYLASESVAKTNSLGHWLNCDQSY